MLLNDYILLPDGQINRNPTLEEPGQGLSNFFQNWANR